MRRLAGLAMTLYGIGAALPCAAASRTPALPATLPQAIDLPTAPIATPLTLAPAPDRLAQTEVSALNDAAFVPRSVAVDVEPAASFVEREAYALGQGPVQYRSGEVRLGGSAEAGAVDSLRVNIAGILRTPGGLPLNLTHGAFDPQSVDVTLIRSWPGAVSFSSDRFAVDLEPRAGFGVSSYGGQAVGGATLTVSTSREQRAVQRLKAMGIGEGRRFGDTGRWYVFAAADGRAVGLNMLHGEQGWDRAGWTTDATGALVGDAQVGVGWRKGDVQSSFGVIHREIRGQHMIFGQGTRQDTVAAFSFSIRPGR
jgi:hypothetical protein